jgi:vacuolar-type H+-ATPase subunit I/STV1
MTFPFLFAVMFGDVGHASVLMAAGVVLIANERKMMGQDLGDMLSILFGGRCVKTALACFWCASGFWKHTLLAWYQAKAPYRSVLFNLAIARCISYL